MSADRPTDADATVKMQRFSKNLTILFTFQLWKLLACPGAIAGSNTLKARHYLDANLTPGPCDDPLTPNGQISSRDFLQILMGNNSTGRGYHYGTFQWNNGVPIGGGKLWGVTNAGTHRIPWTTCDHCNEQGHMEGRIYAKITSGPHAGSEVFGNYVINFNIAPAFFQGSNGSTYPGIQGAVEGVIVRYC